MFDSIFQRSLFEIDSSLGYRPWRGFLGPGLGRNVDIIGRRRRTLLWGPKALLKGKDEEAELFSYLKSCFIILDSYSCRSPGR